MFHLLVDHTGSIKDTWYLLDHFSPWNKAHLIQLEKLGVLPLISVAEGWDSEG